MTLSDTDKFLVGRSGTNYSVESQALMAQVDDNDLLLVSRGGTNYKVTGLELKDSFGSGSIYPGHNDISTDIPYQGGTGTKADPYILAPLTVAPYGGSVSSTETLTIIGQQPLTPVVWKDNSVDAGTRFTQIDGQETDSSGVWAGKLDYVDIPASEVDSTYIGLLQIGLVFYQWTIAQLDVATAPPSVTNVSLVEADPEGDRFTSQSFIASSQVIDGIPTSVKTFDAHVDGTLSKTVKFDEPLESSGSSASQPEYSGAMTTSATPGPDGPLENAFDGSLTTTTYINSLTGRFDFNFNAVTPIVLSTAGKKIEWYLPAEVAAGSSNTLILVSNAGSEVFNQQYSGAAGWRDLTAGFPNGVAAEDINYLSVVAANGPPFIAAIRIGGQILVSNGPGDTALTFAADADMEGLAGGDTVNQTYDFTEPLESQGSSPGPNYSSYLTCPTGFQNNSGPDRAFDGATNEPPYANSGAPGSEPPRITWDCSSYGFTDTDTVELWFGSNGSWVEFIDTSGTAVGGKIGNITANAWWSPDTGPIPNLAAIRTYNKTNQAGGISSAWAAGVRVNGTILRDGQQPGVPALIFANGTDMSALEAGDAVSQGATSGTVGSITDTTATLSSSTGTWVDGQDVTTGDKTTTGTVAGVSDTTATLSSSSGSWANGFNVTGPQKTIVEQNARLYCAFDSSGNITDLQNNPQDPPYTTTDSNPGLTFTFPATFPSGQTPDDELPEGTTLTVDFTAKNNSGTSGPVSATVQPEGPPAPVPVTFGWNADTDVYTRDPAANRIIDVHVRIRRCLLTNPGVPTYLDADDSTKLAGDWLRLCETTELDTGYTGTHGAEVANTALRAAAPAWTAGTYTKSQRVTNGGSVWECIAANTTATPAAGTAAATLNGATAQVMVEIPRFSVWHETAPAGSFQQHTFNLALGTKVNGGYAVHPAFVKPDNSYRDFIYVGAYLGSGTGGNGSASGTNNTVDITRAECRTACSGRGAGWHQLGYWENNALQWLLITEYQDMNSQRALGNGAMTGNDPYVVPAGLSNARGNRSGNAHTRAGADSDYMSYRGVENFHGRAWNWIDGINVQNQNVYLNNNPADWADNTAINYTANGSVPGNANGSYQRDVMNGIALLPFSTTGASETTFIGDGLFSTSSGWRVAMAGGNSANGALVGAFFLHFNSSSLENHGSVGGRLSYASDAAPPAARSQTNEEFVETTAKFLTYDNRKQVKEGEDALAEREQLVKEAENLGLTTEQIEKVFNNG